MGRHDTGNAEADHYDPCREWKAYADRCFDYGLRQGEVVAETKVVKAYEEGFRHGVAICTMGHRKEDNPTIRR